MNTFIRFFIRLLPNDFVEEINAACLDQLNERGLIIWADDVDSGAIIWADDLEKINNQLFN